MVTTIKTKEEYDSIECNNNFGTKFDLYELNNAKSKKYFRVMKEFIQQQESKGVEFFYMCTDLPNSDKHLAFKVIGNERDCVETKYGIWNIADQIRDDVQPKIKLGFQYAGSTLINGTPTCCPYFG